MVSARTPQVTRVPIASRSVLATPAIPHVRHPSTLGRLIARRFGGGVPARQVVLPLLDVLAAAIAVYLAFALRFDDLTPIGALAGFIPVVLLPLAVRPLANRWFGLYAHSWRHVSVPELLRIVIATAAGSAVMVAAFAACALVAQPIVAGFPRSFWLLEGGLSLALMGFLRLAPRILADVSRASSPGNRQSRTIMYGAGDAGAMMARGAARQPSAGVFPVAFLDDNPAKWGRIHAGIRVRGGFDQLAAVAHETDAELILITMPTASGDVIRRIAEEADRLGLTVRTVPSMGEMLNGTFEPHAIRPLSMEDLLRRPPVSSDVLAGLAADLGDETVLVTGAGGSIGSELARQVAALSPRKLILLDRAEGPLYELQREIDTRRAGGSLACDPTFAVGDITNRPAMERLIRDHRPSVIFHAAAYKHVPMMEAHPSAAVEVNVGGTWTLLDLAAEYGVDRFVFVSTDKAVDPKSVMGATKRLAELLVFEYAHRSGRRWSSVRFGNVLGSSGSVIPIFQKQLDNGEPLTVTHEEMTRFFMTIPEAVHLILEAAIMAKPADLFVLDMGEPVRIVDLARDLMRLRGVDPTKRPMVFTGLRPGERLHETLFYSHENVVPTAHPKIMRVRPGDIAEPSYAAMARAVLSLAANGEDARVRTELMSTVRQTAPKRAVNRPRSLGVVSSSGRDDRALLPVAHTAS